MIFFDNTSYVLTPNYYVQKMFSSNQGDMYLENVILKDSKDSVLAASCVQDSKTGDIILKLVNAGNATRSMKIDLSRFKKIIPDAEQVVLSGNSDAANTYDNPHNIAPVKSEFKAGKSFEYAAPPSSVTVIRIRTK